MRREERRKQGDERSGGDGGETDDGEEEGRDEDPMVSTFVLVIGRGSFVGPTSTGPALLSCEALADASYHVLEEGKSLVTVAEPDWKNAVSVLKF